MVFRAVYNRRILNAWIRVKRMDVFKDTAAHLSFSADKMKKVNLFDTERMFCDVYCFEPGQTRCLDLS
jgi:hypothetical protein